jgi:hypothetical protein
MQVKAEKINSNVNYGYILLKRKSLSSNERDVG